MRVTTSSPRGPITVRRACTASGDRACGAVRARVGASPRQATSPLGTSFLSMSCRTPDLSASKRPADGIAQKADHEEQMGLGKVLAACVLPEHRDHPAGSWPTWRARKARRSPARKTPAPPRCPAKTSQIRSRTRWRFPATVCKGRASYRAIAPGRSRGRHGARRQRSCRGWR